MARTLQEELSEQHFEHFLVDFPRTKVARVTLNRPQKLNCIDQSMSKAIARIWERFDEDETLWVGIITGNGRAFCTGADLDEWNEMNRAGVVNSMAAPGLAGLPRRAGKKPIIAAVNGITMGGGMEMVANCDVVVAAASATFALPEAKRGIVPVAGCLPRLASTLGLQRTMDLVLTGRTVTAALLEQWGLVARLVPTADEVAEAAIELAEAMCSNSPDALIVGRLGVRMAWEHGNAEEAVSRLESDFYPRLVAGPNFREGIQAFVEKRGPRWLDSKL